MKCDLRHQTRGGEAAVVRCRKQEAEQTLQVQRMGGSADGEMRRPIRVETVACRMTKRAVQADPFIAETLDRQSGRQPLALFPGETEGAVAAVSCLVRSISVGRVLRDEIGEDPRQDHEDRIGQAGYQLTFE